MFAAALFTIARTSVRLLMLTQGQKGEKYIFSLASHMSYVGEKLIFKVRKGLCDQTKEKIFLHTRCLDIQPYPGLRPDRAETATHGGCKGQQLMGLEKGCRIKEKRRALF